MEKVFEVFILYMDMVASFGHVTKLICWSIVLATNGGKVWKLITTGGHDDNLC